MRIHKAWCSTLLLGLAWFASTGNVLGQSAYPGGKAYAGGYGGQAVQPAIYSPPPQAAGQAAPIPVHSGGQVSAVQFVDDDGAIIVGDMAPTPAPAEYYGGEVYGGEFIEPNLLGEESGIESIGPTHFL